ncbi:MAG: hypothetical protein ABL867_09380 [Rickettsiales bacterium]
MRKLILIGLVTFVLMFSAVISIVWFSRASAVKKDVEAYLNSVGTENLKVTYKEVNVSGFPVSMNVSIVNPRITGRINRFMEEVSLNKIFNLNNMPEWHEDYVLNGSISLIANAFSNKFRVESHGELVGKGSIGDKTVATLNQPSGSTICELQLVNDGWLLGNLWDFYLLHKDKVKIAQNTRSIDCVIPATNITNSETKEPLMTYGGSRFFISRNPQKDHADIRLYILIKDMEATKSYDALYKLYTDALSPETISVMPSSYGKQNTEIDVLYSGTENWKNPQAMNSPFSLKINKFLLANSAYQSDTSASFAYDIKDNMRNASFSYKTETTATELLRSILHTQFYNMIEQLKRGSSEYAQETKLKLSRMSREDTNKMLYSVIPDFNTLGKITTKIDANYAGNDNFTNFNADLKALDFSTASYGVTTTGSVKADAANPIPVGNLSIACANCALMLDNMAAYVEHLQYVMSIFSPKNNSQLANITSDSVKSFKEFLLALVPAGTAENNGTLKFDIINDGKNLTVNGKNSMEVLGLFNKHVAKIPEMETIAPVAAQAPAPKNN